ncbi:MAG: protein kinase [Anaerolineaceae bacterium]|jgi:serine/threonine protein kinase/Tol biopolymer transport system component
MTLELRSLLHNRYRIEQIIAQGGMGAIYRATDESLGVDVAVKENLFTTEESTRQFRREATILAGLRQSNLPRVTDHFVVPDQGQYLVMDYVEGEDLRQTISRDGKLPETDVVFIGSVICDALSYLHSRPSPIIHRDIKPGNIKVTPTKQIYLVDFGLAKESQAGQATTIGAQALTPGYAPPEQYGQGTNPISDIYSLAATLYAALTGQIPEDGLARAMGSATLTPIRKYNPAVSERVAAVIEKAMSVDISQRYQSAENFKQALLSSNTAALQRTQLIQRQASTTAPSDPTISLPEKKVTSPLPQSAVSQPISTPVAKPALPVIPLVIGAFILLGLVVVGALLVFGGSFLLGGSQKPTTPAPPPTQIAVIPPTSTATTAPKKTSAPTNNVAPATSTIPVAVVIQAPTATFTPSATPLGGGAGQIAFASTRSGIPQIWTMDITGQGLKQVTNVQDGACQPSWSPDGKKLVYVSPCKGKQDSYKNAGLFIINADGTGLTILPSHPAGDYDPAWSPDGDRIAFTSLRQDIPHIFVYNLKDHTTIRLSSQSTYDSHAAWSPDASKIAFETTRQGQPQIWVISSTDTTGKTATEFTKLTDGNTYSPDWSHPDGGRIIYSEGSGPWLASREYPPSITDQVKIAEQIFPVFSPRYSQDGMWIVFEGVKTGNHEIFIMTQNGSQLTQLTNDPAFDFQPAWRPTSAP